MATSKRSNPRRDGRAGQTPPPEGKVRLSQVVTTFGPGAMVDLLEHAVLVGGTDFWRYDKGAASGFIHEPRLYDTVARRLEPKGIKLNVGGAFRLPPEGDDAAPSRSVGIAVAEFPAWFICQECRALWHAKDLDSEKGRYIHRCANGKRGTCVPVRFVATCPKGHLEEFPWPHFHRAQGSDCNGTNLFLEEDASGDLSQVVVRCGDCGKERPLSTAREPKVLPRCGARRPWLGYEGQDPDGCEEHLNLLVRTATSAYFSHSISALSIPDEARELLDVVSAPAVWSIIKDADLEVIRYCRQKIAVTRDALARYEDEDVLAALDVIRHGKTLPRDGLRTAEYKWFMAQPEEVPGASTPRDQDYFARRVPKKELALPASIERVVLAKKLRQVRAQIGLTRLSGATPNLQGDYEDASRLQPLGLTTDWLPAMELRGEGVLLVLDEVAVRAWEQRKAVQDREQVLREGFEREVAGSSASFPGIRFYLLHSLSHLLMSSISLSCGYSASSLSERIYCAPATDPLPMAAILVMTGTPGAEGTLGGLVEEGRHLLQHLRRAYDMGALCSNDPVCGSHLPDAQATRNLEGAACHGCLFVAEPACERFNRFLDRALVVPTMGAADVAFFAERP
jgi:hypothetical protein